MKRFLAGLAVLSVVASAAFVLGYCPPPANAEGEVVCTVAVKTGGATDTQQIDAGGGSACNWAAGSAVIMQCPNVEVCYDPAALDRLSDGGLQQLLVRNLEADGGLGPTDGGTLADGGAISTTSTRGNVATSADLCVDFTTSKDPILIGLNPNERNISLIATVIGDGGTTGVCKMAATRRRIPAP